MARKITVKLSEKAEKYFNEVIYSIDFGTGKEPTISDAINYIVETLSDIEDVVGDPVTFVGQYKTFEEVEPEVSEEAMNAIQEHCRLHAQQSQ